MENKTYTFDEVEKIFIEAFGAGFQEGKTRNIVTSSYYTAVISKALVEWKTKLKSDTPK